MGLNGHSRKFEYLEDKIQDRKLSKRRQAFFCKQLQNPVYLSICDSSSYT